MTAKSVLLRPRDLRPRARAPTCYVTGVNEEVFYRLPLATLWCIKLTLLK